MAQGTSVKRAARWVAGVGAWGVLSVATMSAGEVSPLNLSPGFPTLLDDAYPVNKGAIVVQPAARFDKTEDQNAVRVRTTMDLRWGAAQRVELFVGSTAIHGPDNPGTMDDPRAIRMGGLFRLTRQAELGGVGPSLAMRATLQIPYNGPGVGPAVRTDLLSSWELSSGWWGHVNLGYQVVPGGEPGLQAPGRNSVWYGRVGAVKALVSDLGLIVSGTFSQDYTRPDGYVTIVEGGLTYSIMQDLILGIGVGRDIGNSPFKASVRGNIGLSVVW